MVDVSPPAVYDAAFYQSLDDGTRRSADNVVPLLIELFRPESVVDVGCGTGLWLSTFYRRDVTEVLGIDGPWVSSEQREIPEAAFLEHDLNQPIHMDRNFDLALCLEVAEHLPERSARPLVESLTRLAPIVVFSAAIPSQGGEGHCNEQWPSFWSELFAAYGFSPLVDLRQRIWTNEAVDIWYRQNMVCYGIDDKRESLDGTALAHARKPCEPFDVVHPRLFLRFARELERMARELERLEGRILHLVEERNLAQSELAAIKRSRAWPFYRALRRGFAAARRLLKLFRLA